jgi:hypothetical protein
MKKATAILQILLMVVASAGQVSAMPELGAEKEEPVPAQFEAAQNASNNLEIPQRLGILGAEVFLYDVSNGGIVEYRDDWSKLASRRVVISAALTLKGMGYDPSIIPNAAFAREVFALKAKMRYHCMAFRSRFYSDRSMYVRSMNATSDRAEIGAFYTSTLVDTVKYSIGSTDSLCNRHGVDGFVYVYGFQENRGGRQLRPKGAALLSERGVTDGYGRVYVAAILVGRDGRVLWYKDLALTGAIDLRTDKYSAGIVGALFE